jgi:hypothetical protein
MDGTGDVLEVIRHRLSQPHVSDRVPAPKRGPDQRAVSGRGDGGSPGGWHASPGPGG